jgi:hypothetical protein
MAKRKHEDTAEEVNQELAQGADESAHDGPDQPTEETSREDAAAEAPARPEPATSTLVRMDNGQTEATGAMRELLLDACDRFGVDPTEESNPRELINWKYYHEDVRNRVPASVVLVTAGGVKVRHYADPDYLAPGCTELAMDQDTEEILARIFGAFTKDPQTKEIRRTALPKDLALPPQAVTGLSQAKDHQYRRGYLREGGKVEADRREKATKAKRK